MPSDSLTIDQILTMLVEAPPRLTALTADLTTTQLHAKPDHDEWSANDVLAHLRSCADVWGNCIEVILAQDKPTIRAINPRTWIKSTNYLEQKFQPSLRAFATQRTGLLKELNQLAPNDWSREATVTGAGAVLKRTLHIYAQWLARHERPHIKQIERIVKMLHT